VLFPSRKAITGYLAGLLVLHTDVVCFGLVDLH
jgi:hypothetical protein